MWLHAMLLHSGGGGKAGRRRWPPAAAMAVDEEAGASIVVQSSWQRACHKIFGCPPGSSDTVSSKKTSRSAAAVLVQAVQLEVLIEWRCPASSGCFLTFNHPSLHELGGAGRRDGLGLSGEILIENSPCLGWSSSGGGGTLPQVAGLRCLSAH